MKVESQQLAEAQVSSGQEQQQSPALAMLEAMLATVADQKFRQFSKARFAEEREWYEAALFYQRRQWLSWNSSTKRWQLIKKDSSRPKPMPVTNHFARTINALANQLGAKLPAMVAKPHDDSDQCRRSADMAEKAIPAIDRESGMRLLNPLLAKHVAMWGTGVTKDFYDLSASTGSDVVAVPESQASLWVACYDCQGNYEAGPTDQPDVSNLQMACPQCGSANTKPYVQMQQGAVSKHRFSKGKLCTEVRPIFEVYLPRDCQDPNLAGEIVHKYRKPLGVARRIWGEKATQLRADDKVEINEIYLEALRSLVNYNYMHEQKGEELCSIIEYHADYDQLPKKLTDLMEQLAGQDLDPQQLEEIQEAGVYVVVSGGKTLDWGPNPSGPNKKIFTFYCWEKDPANVYCKAPASDLIPIQKRLNRLDSLIELAVQTNAVGKWLWPQTQTTPKPSGSPNEVIEYDPIGDGKNKPEFVLPHPFSPSVWQLRAQILEDFNQLGMTNAVQQGMAPGGGKMPFRGLAYLGAKASEQMNTARALWEMAHQLRYEKMLLLAQQNWTEPRQTAVAGFNGRSSMMRLIGSNLEGGYTLEFVADSSRPVTLDEKFGMFQMLAEAQLIDPADPATRDYVLDLANLEGINLADHLQYEKAARDLDRMKQGQPPQPNPYMKWDIHLRFFASFIQTEEYEGLPPQIQQGLAAYTQYLNMQMSMVASPLGGMMGPVQQLAGAMASRGGKPLSGGGSGLSAIPGETASADTTQDAALKQGAVLGSKLP